MGKNVLIIGASGDIGFAIAEQLVKDGYQLMLHFNKNKAGVDKIEASVEKESILTKIQADLCDSEEIKRFLTELVFPVDSIIFASGTAQHGLFQDVTDSAMNDMLSLYVKAPWVITKELLPRMIQNKSGEIIFITSIWGGVGASNEVIYSAVKGAQNSFVKALAKEVAPSGVSVNGISPGFIDTKMNKHLINEEKKAIISEIPMNRAGTPKDIANTISFLMNKKSNYIQGEIIHINGGWY